MPIICLIMCFLGNNYFNIDMKYKNTLKKGSEFNKKPWIKVAVQVNMRVIV